MSLHSLPLPFKISRLLWQGPTTQPTFLLCQKGRSNEWWHRTNQYSFTSQVLCAQEGIMLYHHTVNPSVLVDPNNFQFKMLELMFSKEKKNGFEKSKITIVYAYIVYYETDHNKCSSIFNCFEVEGVISKHHSCENCTGKKNETSSRDHPGLLPLLPGILLPPLLLSGCCC